MQIIRIFLLIALLAITRAGHAAEGLIALESPHTIEVTMQRLEQQVANRNLKVFARIDHSEGAAMVGKTLRPTLLLIFGNPRGGTPFMQCEQTVGIELPLRTLVWEDATGQVRVGYIDPAVIAARFGVTNCPVVNMLANVLKGISKATVAE